MANVLTEKAEELTAGKELPEGWTECQISDICDVRDGTHDSPKYVENGFPLVTSKNLKNGKISFDNINLIKEEDYNKINERSKVNIGDILFAMIGTIGNPVVIYREPNFAIKNVALFRKSSFLIPEFLKYYLDSSLVQSKMQSEAKGSTQKFVGLGYLRDFPIPLPPLPEQARIVDKIEELFSNIDAGIEKLELARREIRQYKQSVLKSAFEGKLTNISLSICKVSDLGTIVTGNTPSKSETTFYGEEYPFFKPTDLNAGYFVEFANDNLSAKGFNTSRKLPSKSILVTCIGATIGKTGLIRVAGTCNQQINAIIPSKNFIPEYIYFYCICHDFQNMIKSNASATTLPILNKSSFEKLEFKNCSLEEQQKIVEEIEKRFEAAEGLEKAVIEGLAQAKQLKQSILKKAFEGRLVPQDPNDEPASVLLERIRAGKAQTLNKKGRK